MCDYTFFPHLHGIKYIDSFPHVYSTQYIDSYGENGDFFEKLQNLHFSNFLGVFKLNQELQSSMKILNIPKKPFEKSVQNMSIHLKLLTFA